MFRKKSIKWSLVCFIAGCSISLMFLSCGEKESADPAQRIIDKAIKANGSKIFDHSTVEFKFRDRYYKSTRTEGNYRYERFWDSTGIIIHDELTNAGLIRHVGQIKVILDAKKIDAYTNSVNSVFYFFALPFNLNDPAVIKELLGEVTLLDQRYDKIKITFKQNPSDKMIHEDVYVFWINKSNYYIDYIGYYYVEPGETGTRFRQAINRRKINGLTVQDYINFKPINDSTSIEVPDLDQAWVNNQLKELSRIINESVKVTLKK
ncbi:MAG: DUF6503 family protein [Saprospiraceae bacterium]